MIFQKYCTAKVSIRKIYTNLEFINSQGYTQTIPFPTLEELQEQSKKRKEVEARQKKENEDRLEKERIKNIKYIWI